MAERFPCSDEQIEKVKPKNKNTMKEALKIIEATNKALKNYEGIVELTFEDLKKEELEKFAKQENIHFLEPSEFSRYYFSIWKTEKVKVYFRTKTLKIKEIIFEDEE